MSQNLDMNLMIGDEVGFIKSIAGKNVSSVSGPCDRKYGIEQMTWTGNTQNGGIVYFTRNGKLNYLRGKYMELHNKDVEKPSRIDPKLIETYQGKHFDEMGALSMNECKGLEYDNEKLYCCSNSGKLQVLNCFPDKDIGNVFGNQILSSIEAGPKILKMKRSPVSGFIATGGEENPLTLWDMEKQKNVFRAKNVSHDFLDMRVPIYVTDMCFYPVTWSGKGPKLSISGCTPEKIITCTGHSQIRIYDTRVQKKPVSSGSFGIEDSQKLNNSNIAAVSDHMNCIVAADPNSVIVGNATGDVFKVDLRTMKQTGRFKSFNGSVKSLAIHPTLPLLASICMDRHVRIHNINTRKIESKIYVKQRLTSLAFCPPLEKSQVEPESSQKKLKNEKKKRKDEKQEEEDTIVPFHFKEKKKKKTKL